MSARSQAWLGLAALAAAAAGGLRPPTPGVNWGNLPAWAAPVLIFTLQSGNLALDTFRTLAVARGRRLVAWAAGFGQSLLFVTAIAGVLQGLQSPWNLVAYAGGFATGTVIGIAVEGRLAPGHSLLRIISPRRGSAIAEVLRQEGWGATEIPGRGQAGTVSVIYCHVPRRHAEQVWRRVVELDADAFVTSEAVRQFRGGWRA